jgi:hypothetical protein
MYPTAINAAIKGLIDYLPWLSVRIQRARAHLVERAEEQARKGRGGTRDSFA